MKIIKHQIFINCNNTLFRSEISGSIARHTRNHLPLYLIKKKSQQCLPKNFIGADHTVSIILFLFSPSNRSSFILTQVLANQFDITVLKTKSVIIADIGETWVAKCLAHASD